MKQLWHSRITLKAWKKSDWYPCNRLQWLIKLFSLLIHSDSCGLQLYVGLYQIIACVTMYLCLQLTKFSFQITLSNTPMLIFCISSLWSKEARNECCVVEERLYYRISNLGPQLSLEEILIQIIPRYSVNLNFVWIGKLVTVNVTVELSCCVSSRNTFSIHIIDRQLQGSMVVLGNSYCLHWLCSIKCFRAITFWFLKFGTLFS